MMSNDDRDTLPLQDEDRLPWLEAVDDDADAETISTGKLIGFAIAGTATGRTVPCASIT